MATTKCAQCGADNPAPKSKFSYCQKCGMRLVPGQILAAASLSATEPAPPPFPGSQAVTFWFKPLPAERIAVARSASVMGLLSCIALFAFFGIGGLVLCVTKPMQLGMALLPGLAGGLVLALAVHFLAVRGSGRRITLPGFLVIVAVFAALAFGTNATAKYQADLNKAVDDATKQPAQMDHDKQRENVRDDTAAERTEAIQIALLQRRVQDFYEKLASDDKQVREQAVRDFLYSVDDLPKLFPQQESLKFILSFPAQDPERYSSLASQELGLQYQKTRPAVKVVNLRKSTQYSRIMAHVPADIPAYYVTMQEGSQASTHGACFQLGDRWVWIPVFKELLKAPLS